MRRAVPSTSLPRIGARRDRVGGAARSRHPRHFTQRPLAKSDFTRLAREIDPVIAANGRLNGLMVCARAFSGWDSIGGFMSHLGFVRNHHRSIDRIAAVTDSGALTFLAWISKFFVSTQVRQFPADHGTEALAWLEAGRADPITVRLASLTP